MIKGVGGLLRSLVSMARQRAHVARPSLAVADDREEGWPERDFDPSARDYLLDEARQRVQEQLAQITAQDVKCAAIITISVLLVSASGLIGEPTINLTVAGVLTPITFGAALITWILGWLAYQSRPVGAGVNVSLLRTHYRRASAGALRGAALEALVLDFEQNQVVLTAKEQWLRYAVRVAGVQGALLLAVLIARAVEGEM